jgi:hypothetical protein
MECVCCLFCTLVVAALNSEDVTVDGSSRKFPTLENMPL